MLASLADAEHSTEKKTSNPGGRSPSWYRKVPAEAACGGRSSRTAHPSGRATEVGGRSGYYTIPGAEHLLSAALDTTPYPSSRMNGSVRKSLPLGAGIGLCPLSWQTLAGLYPDSLAGSGRFCAVLVCALRAQTYHCSGVDTTHRPGGSRALSSSRATHFPNLSDFWSAVRHRFNGVAMAELASGLLSEALRFPGADLAGRLSERAPLAGVPPWICCRCLQWQPP